MKRALTPTLNPTGIGSAIAAIYAGIVMIWNASHHHAVIDPQVVLAALGAAAFLYTRFKVTPVADPKDGNGVPLAALAPIIPMPGTISGAEAEQIKRQLAAAMCTPSRTAVPAAPDDPGPGGTGPA